MISLARGGFLGPVCTTYGGHGWSLNDESAPIHFALAIAERVFRWGWEGVLRWSSISTVLHAWNSNPDPVDILHISPDFSFLLSGEGFVIQEGHTLYVYLIVISNELLQGHLYLFRLALPTL